jgi:hypothetical protein
VEDNEARVDGVFGRSFAGSICVARDDTDDLAVQLLHVIAGGVFKDVVCEVFNQHYDRVLVQYSDYNNSYRNTVSGHNYCRNTVGL